MTSKLSERQEYFMYRFVLTERTIERSKNFSHSLKFLFSEIKKMEKLKQQKIKKSSVAIQNKNPGLSKVRDDHKLLFRLLETERRIGVLCQCLLLQISSWIDDVSLKYSHILADMKHEVLGKQKHSTESKIHKTFIKNGKMFRGQYWGQLVQIGANYVRHRQQWRCSPFESNKKKNGELKYRRDIVSTIIGKKARKNASILVQLGVSQGEMLGEKKDVSKKILELIDSASLQGLRTNCELWAVDVQKQGKAKFHALLSQL